MTALAAIITALGMLITAGATAYATIKNVLIERSAVLKKYMEFSNEDVNPLIASQVSSILIAPIKKDASLFFKITLIIFWFISFIAPIILYFLF